jgi:cytoskeletal protein CcmA (bactofilin family)
MSGLDKIEAADLKQTTVEEGTQFKGTLQSTCRVVVRGSVEGELQAPAVVVAETGSVTGNVKAQSLHSSGVLAGRIDVEDLVLSGSVHNDTVIRARSLEVKLHQPDAGKIEVKFGECILEVGDDPALELGLESSGSRPASVSQLVKKGGGGRKQEPAADAPAKVASGGAEITQKPESNAS